MTGETEIFGALNNLLVSIGVIATFSFVIWILYKLYNLAFNRLSAEEDKDQKYTLVEELAVNKTAEKKGLNLNKELIKKQTIKEGVDHQTFQEKLRQEVREDFFGKEKVEGKE